MPEVLWPPIASALYKPWRHRPSHWACTERRLTLAKGIWKLRFDKERNKADSKENNKQTCIFAWLVLCLQTNGAFEPGKDREPTRRYRASRATSRFQRMRVSSVYGRLASALACGGWRRCCCLISSKIWCAREYGRAGVLLHPSCTQRKRSNRQ